jgi:hypothetical protein
VWLFYPGTRDLSFEQDGIKYVTSMGYDYPYVNVFNANRIEEIVITINDGVATYDFVPVMQK